MATHLARGHDRGDAEAVLTALHAPGMCFVTIKTEEQQQRLAWHRLREGWKAERTALFNRIRGLLTEFGIVVELGATKIRRKLAELESDTAYPQSIRLMAQSVREQVGVLDKRLAECERQIARQSTSDPAVVRLRSRPGIGPLTADAIVATVGDAHQFKNGRQFAASLGITPRQHGSGGKTHLGAITRRGDTYLRSLLVQGARSILVAALRLHKNKPDTLNRLQLWMVKLHDRVGYHKAAVAIANKHARQVWAMITRREAYNADAYKDWEAAHATACPMLLPGINTPTYCGWITPISDGGITVINKISVQHIFHFSFGLEPVAPCVSVRKITLFGDQQSIFRNLSKATFLAMVCSSSSLPDSLLANCRMRAVFLFSAIRSA